MTSKPLKISPKLELLLIILGFIIFTWIAYQTYVGMQKNFGTFILSVLGTCVIVSLLLITSIILKEMSSMRNWLKVSIAFFAYSLVALVSIFFNFTSFYSQANDESSIEQNLITVRKSLDELKITSTRELENYSNIIEKDRQLLIREINNSGWGVSTSARLSRMLKTKIEKPKVKRQERGQIISKTIADLVSIYNRQIESYKTDFNTSLENLDQKINEAKNTKNSTDDDSKLVTDSIFLYEKLCSQANSYLSNIEIPTLDENNKYTSNYQKPSIVCKNFPNETGKLKEFKDIFASAINNPQKAIFPLLFSIVIDFTYPIVILLLNVLFGKDSGKQFSRDKVKRS